MDDILGIGRAQLYTDSPVELLQGIAQATDRLLIGILLATRILSFLSFNPNRVSVMHHAPGSDLDTSAAN